MTMFMFIWYIFSGFGIMYLEKSGTPGDNSDAAMKNDCTLQTRKKYE
jgi:hypothetical protein